MPPIPKYFAAPIIFFVAPLLWVGTPFVVALVVVPDNFVVGVAVVAGVVTVEKVPGVISPVAVGMPLVGTPVGMPVVGTPVGGPALAIPLAHKLRNMVI